MSDLEKLRVAVSRALALAHGLKAPNVTADEVQPFVDQWAHHFVSHTAAALAAINAAGFAVVPKVATREMQEAVARAICCPDGCCSIYNGGSAYYGPCKSWREEDAAETVDAAIAAMIAAARKVTP
jgi:hypothetical protein